MRYTDIFATTMQTISFFILLSMQRAEPVQLGRRFNSISNFEFAYKLLAKLRELIDSNTIIFAHASIELTESERKMACSNFKLWRHTDAQLVFMFA